MTASETRTANRLAVVATLLGMAAGVAELVVGTSSWIGNKNDPTTLGWVTIGLALGLTAAAAVADRIATADARLAAGLAMVLAALIGLTTAGRVWIPAAIAGATAGAVHVMAAHRRRPIRQLVDNLGPAALLAVLACIYLTFGVVAGGGVGGLGVVGAVAVIVALAIRRRWRLSAAALLIGGAVPFAAVAVWTVVIPLTAVLILAIGLPLVHPSRGPSMR